MKRISGRLALAGLCLSMMGCASHESQVNDNYMYVPSRPAVPAAREPAAAPVQAPVAVPPPVAPVAPSTGATTPTAAPTPITPTAPAKPAGSTKSGG